MPRLSFAVAATLALITTPSSGALIQVPADHANLQTALDACDPGDTVLVAPGIYDVNLLWPETPGLKLLSEAGSGATVLDGGERDQVIGVYSGVDSSTVIRGFTITGGIAGGQ